MPWRLHLSIGAQVRRICLTLFFAAIPLAGNGSLVVTNLGLAGVGFPISRGDWLAFSVSESAQGVDLNGDGDTSDFVLHVRSLSTGVTTNLGLAGGVVQIDGDYAVLFVSESQQGTDLNGDGDSSDGVLFVFQLSTHVLVNLGVASGGFARADGGWLFFNVDEASQGNMDLNGDGDTLDTVFFVSQLSTGVTTNLGLAASHAGSPVGMAAGWATFSVGEAEQGNSDLNGDGDSNDSVIFVRDFAAGATTNLQLQCEISWITLDAQWLSFVVTEAKQGNADLNGDGDTLDYVLHVYDRATGTITNLETDVADWDQDGDWIAFQASEEGQGESDLNGDGDVSDYVMQVRRLSTGETRNLGLAVSSISNLHGDWLPFNVDEDRQGMTDLNGDGDSLDSVLHVYQVSTDTVSNSSLAADWMFTLDGDWMGIVFPEYPTPHGDWMEFQVPEYAQGGTDLNGDGDAADDVVYLRQLSTGVTTNLGLAWSGTPPALLGDWLEVSVIETRQGNSDLNEDGDVDPYDQVPFVRELSTGAMFRIPLAGSGGAFLNGGWLTFEVAEYQQGNTDLNGDGDALDGVLHLAFFSDKDKDGVLDQDDNCPVTPNDSQSDFDSDNVGDACDNCVAVANMRASDEWLASNPWAVLTGGQRDDDHDGFGNVCDGDFPRTSQGGNVNAADLAQFRASVGHDRSLSDCGTPLGSGTMPCAIFDLNSEQNTDGAANINSADLARFRMLLGSPPGPKCATCPLNCDAGALRSCDP